MRAGSVLMGDDARMHASRRRVSFRRAAQRLSSFTGDARFLGSAMLYIHS